MALNKSNEIDSFGGMFQSIKREAETPKFDQIEIISKQSEKSTNEDVKTAYGRSESKKSTKKKKTVERKERYNMCLKPNTWDNFSKVAYMQRLSKSDIMERLIEEYNKKHRDLIKEYDEIEKK